MSDSVAKLTELVDVENFEWPKSAQWVSDISFQEFRNEAKRIKTIKRFKLPRH